MSLLLTINSLRFVNTRVLSTRLIAISTLATSPSATRAKSFSSSETPPLWSFLPSISSRSSLSWNPTWKSTESTKTSRNLLDSCSKESTISERQRNTISNGKHSQRNIPCWKLNVGQREIIVWKKFLVFKFEEVVAEKPKEISRLLKFLEIDNADLAKIVEMVSYQRNSPYGPIRLMLIVYS